MTKDITSREDLRLILQDFYDNLLQSPELSNFFEAFRDEDALQTHLDTLVDFWDHTLFYSGTYKRNAMMPHVKINETKGIAIEDFEKWLTLFNKSVDANFSGPTAVTIKNRALSIATVMKMKLHIS